jgi:hypothetical protein
VSMEASSAESVCLSDVVVIVDVGVENRGSSSMIRSQANYTIRPGIGKSGGPAVGGSEGPSVRPYVSLRDEGLCHTSTAYLLIPWSKKV